MKVYKNRKLYLIFLILLASLIFTGCVDKYADDDVKYLKGVALEKMQDNIELKDNILVIDIRDKESYSQGHTKYAVHIPGDQISNNLDMIADYKETPIIICSNTADQAEKAGEILAKAGFKDVSNADGYQEFEYELVEFNNILPKDMIEKIDKIDAHIVDARPEEDFAKGHIKGAINIPANNHQKYIQQLPRDKNTDITIYCFRGNYSTKLSETLVRLGYENINNQLDGLLEYDYELVKN